MQLIQKNNPYYLEEVNNPLKRIMNYAKGGALIGASIGYLLDEEEGASIGGTIGAIAAVIGGAIIEVYSLFNKNRIEFL